MAPLINAGLFLMIFTIAIGSQRGDVMGVSFLHFIAPGILTMTVIQNAFSNTSSSLASAKVQGNIVDTLMPPLSGAELVAGYVAGAVVRGLIVAVVIAAGAMLFLGVGMAHPLWVLTFVVIGSVFMGGLGLIAAIFANKFDQLAAIHRRQQADPVEEFLRNARCLHDVRLLTQVLRDEQAGPVERGGRIGQHRLHPNQGHKYQRQKRR